MPSRFAPPAVLLLPFLFVSMWLEAASPSLGETVVRSAAIDLMLAQYPVMIREGVEQGMTEAGEIRPDVLSAVGRRVANAFDAERMVGAVVQTLDKEMPAPALQAVNDWLLSPLGRKVIAAEVATTTLEGQKDMEARAAALSKQFQGSRRAKQFTDYDRSMRATDSALDAALAAQHALASTLASVSGGDAAALQSMHDAIDENRFMLRGLVSQQVFGTYLYAYRDLSDADMDAFVAFLNTPAGSAYTKALSQGLKLAMEQPVRELGSKALR